MAGIIYNSDFRSLNGTPYRLQIWDTEHTGSTRDFDTTQGSLQVNFDTAGENKLTEIICSNIEFEFLVQNSTDETWIEYLRGDTIEEKDVYIVLWNGTTGGYEVQWSGYLLLDLGERTDEAFPYGVTIKGVDGLSLLKDIDFVHNADTNSPPYAMADTYILPANTPSGARYANYIKWIVEILGYADFMDTSTCPNSGVPAWKIQTAVNWYNAEHGGIGGTLTNLDPLRYTACNGEQFYTQTGQSNTGVLYYKPLSVYDALQNICRAWGMRCVMYNNVVYFIQVAEYRRTESGTVGIPDNVRTTTYSKAGVFVSTNEALGGNSIDRFELEIENSTAATDGLQKLTGTTWGEYPIVKKVSTNFPSISNFNGYTGFPMLYGKDQSPKTWPTFGVASPGVISGRWEDTTKPLGTFNDAYLLDGFYIMISLQFMNTCPDDVEFQMAWTIRAKPTSSSTWSSSDALVATWSQDMPSGNWQLYWEPYYPLGDLNTELGGTMPGYDGRFINQWNSTLGNTNGNVDDQMFFKNIVVPHGVSTIDIIDGTEVGNNANLMPIHPNMQGDWDFELIARHHGPSHNYGAWFCDWHGATAKIPPMPPITAPPWANIQAGYDPDYPNPPGTLYYGMWGPTYSVWYNDLSPSLGLCMFSPVTGGAIGSSSYNTQYYTNTSDSFILNIKDTLWGDTDNQDVPGSLKVYDGSGWVFTDYLGKWGRGVSNGSNSFTEMLCSDALNMQNIPSQKGNYTLALSVSNKNLSGSASYPKYVNPIGRIVDSLNDHKFVPLKMTQMIDMDETTGMWFQMVWNVATANTTTNPNGGGPDDPIDPHGPIDDDDVGAGVIRNEQTALARQSVSAVSQIAARRMIQPILSIKDNKRRSLKDTTYAFTSLKVAEAGQTQGQTLKTGDKVILEEKGRIAELTLTADFVMQSDATEESPASDSIQFESTSLLWNVTEKAVIYVDIADWYNESLRKTRGTVAGFTVSSTGLTKDGVTINGFTDSDTMEGSDLSNKLPTTESVKAYVDSQSGGGTITSVTAGTNLTGGGSSGDVTLNAPGITTNATAIAGKQGTITLTTEGTSGAATLSDDTLNIPQYSGGGSDVISNYGTYKCSGTTTTSTTTGEASAVVIPFDSDLITSASTSIVLYDGEGPGSIENAGHSWKLGDSGYYEISWTVGTNTNLVNNRILSGVKLQYGTSEGESIGWVDYSPTHCYIYDRGNGSIRKGSTSGSTMYKNVASADNPVYFRLVIWKEAASNASMNSITLVNACSLMIKQLQ